MQIYLSRKNPPRAISGWAPVRIGNRLVRRARRNPSTAALTRPRKSILRFRHPPARLVEPAPRVHPKRNMNPNDLANTNDQTDPSAQSPQAWIGLDWGDQQHRFALQ